MEDMMDSAIKTFKTVTKHPESFLITQNDKSDKIQQDMLETIYLACKDLQKDKKSKSLPKLITAGMDIESIWQQLEIFNEENFQLNLKEVSSFLASNTDKFKVINNDSVSSDGESDQENGLDGNSEGGDDDQDIEQSEDENDQSVDENGPSDDENNPSQDENEQSEDENDQSDDEQKQDTVRKKKGKKSIVDDQFFKLSEMEDFLKDQDRRDMNKNATSEEEIDYFAEENDDINLQESLRYSDFFDNEESDGSESMDEEEADDQPKSSHELKQERLKTKISKMEEEMLEEKIWQMKGEIKSDTRPQNSLLEEILEFDSATRPAPVITESVSVRLEDIIKQRIKDRAFDDVERKVKPSDIQYEYRKQIVLDQEKSKQSLSQIYEKEYLKELEKTNPNGIDEEDEEPKEHKEIRAELKDLFEKLDMLSNFHYTPRPAQPELKIITNLPTISMEEVAPVATNEATLLAPEEVKRKPKGGNVIGAGERTQTDKNRERRYKKLFQKDKFKKDKNNDKNSLVNKVMKSRNVQKIKTTDNSTKSSSAFFSKLQDEISMSTKDKSNKKRKAEKQNHQAKKFKL